MWFEAIWKAKRDNKYVLAFSCMKNLVFTVKYFCGHCVMLESWTLGRWKLYQPQKMCLVCSPKLPPEEWATWLVLVGSRLSHISALIRFWLSIFDIYMYHSKTKKLILWNTGWIVSSMKCSEVNNMLTSNSSGSGFRVPGLDIIVLGLIIMSLSLLLTRFIVSTQGNGC